MANVDGCCDGVGDFRLVGAARIVTEDCAIHKRRFWYDQDRLPRLHCCWWR